MILCIYFMLNFVCQVGMHLYHQLSFFPSWLRKGFTLGLLLLSKFEKCIIYIYIYLFLYISVLFQARLCTHIRWIKVDFTARYYYRSDKFVLNFSISILFNEYNVYFPIILIRYIKILTLIMQRQVREKWP